MIFFGVIGFFMRRYGFSVVPVIIGLILGELVEGTLRQSLVIFDGNWLNVFNKTYCFNILYFIFNCFSFSFIKIKKKQ